VLAFAEPKMDESRLQRLFSQVAAGDECAEEDLFSELCPRLKAIAYGRGVAGGEIDDVVQECMTGVFQQLKLGKFKSLSSPSTWVIAIVLNKIADHFRRRERSQAWMNSAERPSAPAGLSRPSQQTRVEVMEVLGRLTPIERFVLTGTEVGGLTYGEVAARLNIPAGTVASTKHRAVARFRELLSRASQRRPALRGDDGDM
jgi:RNA polymerase sigma-70 factor (ECF subfamily)